MDKVRYGIIGFGGMGGGHAEFLKNIEGAQLTAIADINPEKIEYARSILPDIAMFSTGEELMKSGLVDAVIIATPHYFHPELAIMGFKYGLHVMTEKPAGVYTKQVREMNEAAEKSDKLFGIMYQNRLTPYYQKMHDMIAGNELGKIKRMNLIITGWYRTQSYYDSGTWRATWDGEGGGVLINQCPHNLDLWQWISGMSPVKVRAFTHNGKWHDIEVEDDVTAYVEYENGATATFVTSTGDYPGTTRFEILGDTGKLVMENDKLYHYKSKMSEREFNVINTVDFAEPGCDIIEIECENVYPGHMAVLQNFTDAILKDTPLWIPGLEGIKGLTISNAIHLSSWLDKTVEIPFDEDLFLSELNKRRETSKLKTGNDKIMGLNNSFKGA